MKRLFSTILLVIAAVTVAQAQSSSTSSMLDKLLGKGSSIGSAVSNLLGTNKLTPADLAGTWEYSSPAVSFKSENLLKKAGGAAASVAVENKLKPYYSKAGVDKMVLTVNPDSTFTMKLARGSLSGTLASSSQEGMLTFKFKALKINIGSMDAAVSKAGNNLTVTFDVSKLMSLVNAVAKVSGSSAVKGLNSMLQSYDGVMAGFRLVKTADASTKK
ncbi:MAG: DUF4923 family protein [Duncaniella sp.]|nr:DUF4923 family protein [Duncaniella sp.]